MAVSFRVSPTAAAAQGVLATALGGEGKNAKARSLIGLGMAAFHAALMGRGGRECRPGVR
jgi:hypothetical protein